MNKFTKNTKKKAINIIQSKYELFEVKSRTSIK